MTLAPTSPPLGYKVQAAAAVATRERPCMSVTARRTTSLRMLSSYRGRKHCLAVCRNWSSLICPTPQPYCSHPIGYVLRVPSAGWISTCASSTEGKKCSRKTMTNFMAALRNRRQWCVCVWGSSWTWLGLVACRISQEYVMEVLPS